MDRAFSAYLHLIRDGAIKESFEEAVIAHEKILITDSLYYDHLTPYFELFPKEQLKILFFEDVITQPADFLKEIYGFLGVNNEFLPDDYDKSLNATIQPRFALINKMMLLSHLWLRDRDLYKYFLPLKNTKFVNWLRFRSGKNPIPKMEEKTRIELHGIFDPQTEKLATLIDRDLSHWMLKNDEILSPK